MLVGEIAVRCIGGSSLEWRYRSIDFAAVLAKLAARRSPH